MVEDWLRKAAAACLFHTVFDRTGIQQLAVEVGKADEAGLVIVGITLDEPTDLILSKGNMEWCSGRTRRGKGERISWKTFIEWAESQ